MIFNQDRLRKAREAGYSDDEIWEYASGYDQRMKKARDAGYSLEEVSSFFTPKEEEQAGLLPPVEEMFKPKPKEVGTFEGIANAARNAFASSQQALSVAGGVTPEEAKEISKIEFEKNARQVSPDYKEYQEAQGFDAVKAFARNPFEVTTNIVAEGLAGSLPALGAGLAAGGVGAAVAAPTVVGAPVGFLAGQVAGTFAGSLATEYGSKVLEELQGAGMDINNPDSITDFFSRQELVDAAKDKALKRGVPIAAFDALSAGIGGKVGAITKAAFKTKPREAVAEMAVQAALGGGGEVVGSLAAGDKIDPKAVFAEVVGEVGPGAAEIGVGKIQQTFAERRKQEQIKRAAKVSQDLENNNAPLTADALKTTVAKNAVEEEKATIEETDTALAEEVAKFAPPEDAITKQELKTQYSALSPEDLTDTEATFRERLDDEDPEMRTFAQNALDAIAEVRAEQARARKLPTDVLPTETLGATYGREADIYDVFADIRRRPMPPSGPAFESAQVIEEAARRADILRRTPEGRELLRRELQGEEMVGGVRRATKEALATAPEPAEGDVFAEIRRPSRAEEAAITIEQQLTEDERIRRSQLGAEALREELAQAESQKQQTIVEQEQAKFLPQKETAKILNELTTAEQAAITGSLLSQGLVTRSEALSILRRASDEGVTSGQIAAIEPEATKKWNERTRDGVLAGRVIGEKQTKTGNIILRAEQERTKKPVITKPNSLAPKDVIGKTVREALKFASTQNLIQTKDLIEGRASWASGIVPKPNYAMMQDIAAIMSEQNIPALDKERVIPLSSRGRRGRASRFWGGDIGFPSTMNEDVGTLVHEVGHSLTADLIRKYAPRGSVKSGKDYVGLLGKTINDKSAPDGIRRLFRLYISTLDQLGISDVYTKAGGLAGKRHPDESRNAARKLQSSGKLRDDLKWGDLYALANVEEFVSQTFSSNEFRNLLKTLKDPDTKKSFWREFVQAIKEVFGLPTDSMAAAVIETTFDIGVPKTLEESLIVLKNDIVGRVINYNIPNEDAEFLADEVITRAIESKEIDNDASVNSILEFIETNIIPPLIDGYFAKPSPPAITPTAEVPAIIQTTEEVAVPTGFSVGDRVKTKTTPQSFVVEEVLPQSAREAELGEQYYSIRNERTGETQVVESNDISPIKGKRARKISPVRAEEKYTPVPEADRYTFREASGRAIRFFGGEKPENFVIVNNSTDLDYEFKAGYDPETGEIILNRAYIQRGENIEDILTHELGHYIYSDPQFQADFQDFLDSMPDEARAEIDRIVNEGYNKETNEVQIEEREVMAFTSLIRRTKRGLTAWEKLKDTIKKIINRFLGTNITLSDQGAMAVFNVGYKRFKSGERIIREMKEGTLRTAPEGMTQMDRDYLAAVERGDMETAQRMVDEAAKRAGYDGPWFHGGTIRTRGATIPRIPSEGFFLAKEKNIAESYGRIGSTDPYFFALKNPFNPQNPSHVNAGWVKEWIKFWRDEDGWVDRTTGEDISNAEVISMIQGVELYNYESTGSGARWKDFLATARDHHDGFIGYDPTDNSEIAVAFEPSQIKSADPVTYDDAGNVIPLSQRFRATSPDIRRMAPEPRKPATEAVVEEAPAERPKRRTKMQNIIDISTGVKRPKTKLTVNEMTALKDQIKLGARKRREDKQTQREFAKDVTQYLRDMTIRGKVSAPQLRAITSKAMQTQFDNEASIKSFLNYANRVIENANYDKDVAEAKKTLKRAQQLSKQKEGAANIKSKLAGVLDIDPRDIELDDMTERDVEVDGEIVRKKPISIAEFTAVLKEYMKALGPVTAEGYIVVPDQEFTDFVQTVRDQIGTNKAATDTIGMDGELAAIADKTAEQIDAELEADEERKNRIEQKVNKLAEDAQIALVKYDNPDLTDKEKEILDLIKRITLQDISIGNRKAYIQVANNILVNNKFFGAEKLSSIAAGQIGAAEAAKDSKQVKRNSASLNFLRTLFGENIPGSLLKFENLVNMSGQSFADAFRNFAGKQNMARFLYQIGFGKIEMGQAQANRERREITDNIQARFQQIEEQTKQKISDKQGIMSMGVASHLIQSTPDETEAEALTRMRNLIKQDIEKKKNAPDIEDRKDAAYIEKGLKEVDSDTVQGVLDNLKRLHPANYEALIFLKDEVLPEYKPLLKEHDELFNNQTDNYTNPNYLPIRYRAFTRALQKKEDIERRDNVGVTAPKQSPNSIKRVKNTVIPKDRQFDYNITKNVLDSLSIGLEAARTNAGWEQVNAFLESPNAEAAFNGPENLQFFKDRLSSVRRARLRKVYKMDGWDRLADVFANFIRTVGGGMVLGGFGQAFKQYPAQLATTIANVNDLSITNQALVDIKAATPLMQMFSIGERGEIAGGSKWANQLEGNFSKLEQYMNEGAIPKIKSAFEKFNDIWLLALKKSDTAAAAHGWISYYRKYLKDNNIPFTSWDNEVALAQNNDKDRVQAGLYADQMIDLYQGSSDPTKMAVFAQRGDSGGGNLLKAMIIPFSSFVIQERSRYMSDIRDLSYGDTQERKDAIKGLIATTAGILLFHTVRRYALPLLTGGLATGVYALLGVDMEEPDEEEKKKQEDKVFRQFLGEIAANILVGGYSSMAENALIDTVNRMAYFHDIYTESDNVLNDDGEVMKFETYRKERAPMYRYTGPGADSALGMVDILPSQLSDNLDKLMDLADEELMDSLSVEEQMVLILAAFSETIYTFRLNDADVDRMFSRMSKEVKEQAEDRARAQRALQRIYGQ